MLILKYVNMFSSTSGQVLGLLPYSKSPSQMPVCPGFELLGTKWLPSLTTTQAREVTPYEVGDRHWKESLHTLASGIYIIIHSTIQVFHISSFRYSVIDA